MIHSILEGPIQDLHDAFDDLGEASPRVAHTILQRFIAVLDTEPLASFIRVTVPQNPEANAADALQQPTGSMVGSGTLKWPVDRGERVAAQIAVVRGVSTSEGQLLAFVHTYCNSGLQSYTEDVRNFGRKVLAPLIRDIERLAENRLVPAFLLDAIGTLPASGDRHLDDLLAEALESFRKPTQRDRQKAVEKLWDAWERLKTLDNGSKRMSVRLLLDGAASEAAFREVLERESTELTRIGNEFHIRHFETTKIPIDEAAQLDYLFHRLFALLHFLLFTRTRGKKGADSD